MRNPFKALWNDRRGNVLIIMGAALPVLIGAAGLATDTIQWVLWKRQLQRAADSAAIAGVYERNATANGGSEGVPDAVDRDLALNLHLGALDGDPVIDTPDDDDDKQWTNQVQVTLTYRKQLTFSSLFLASPPPIVAYSHAASVPGAGEYCVIALEDSVATGIDIGGSTYVDLGECCAIANATDPNDSFKNTGNGSTLKAGCIAAVGGVQKSSSANWDVDSYFPYSEPAADPYANVPNPAEADCDETISFGNQVKDDTDRTADAGKVICIDGAFAINANLTLGAATYIINSSSDKDNLTMNSNNASLTCAGCTIIMTNFDDPTDTGNFSLTGGTLNISSPSDADDPYKGIVLYQDRRATDDGSKGANHVRGNNTSGVRGVMYMPSRSLLYNGSGSVAEQQCMQIVAKRVEFSGNSRFKMGSVCGEYGMVGQTGGGWLVRLVG